MRAASNTSTETGGAVVRNEGRRDHQGAIVVDINATAAPVGSSLCFIVNDGAASYLGVFCVSKYSAAFMSTQRAIGVISFIGVFCFVTRDLTTRHLEMTTIPHEYTATSSRFILGNGAAVHDEASSVVHENAATYRACAVVEAARTRRSFASCNSWPCTVFCAENDLAVRAKYRYDRTGTCTDDFSGAVDGKRGATGHPDIAAKRAVDGEGVGSIPTEGQRAGGVGYVAIDGVRRVVGQLLGSHLCRSIGNCLGILLGKRRRHDSGLFACGRLFLTEGLTV
ncbi:hypothetical protein [Adlercreutzia sp.]|uniref:hypothetical protein n=1 Tax=Adlercreutzia sp. TaxID=1872387 RepID=UPI002E7704A5|nr:hypothetical protein [Adlercreutzia sp.]MEE0637922.1 hypothetical protein [Adlercreutzia sp.]